MIIVPRIIPSAHIPMIENPWVLSAPDEYPESPYDRAGICDWIDFVTDRELQDTVLRDVLDLSPDDPFDFWDSLTLDAQEDLVMRWVELKRADYADECDLRDDYNCWKVPFEP